MNNLNFNPLLVHALTNIPIQEISASPSLTDLPGKLGPLVAQKARDALRTFPKNEFVFVCKECGKRGRYDVGHISVNMKDLEKNKSKGIEGSTQTTGYFRCKHCNSAEKWGITQDYQMRLMANLLNFSVTMEDPLFSLSENQLFDGSSHKYASDAEQHLLDKILGDSKNAFLWNRLANLYFKGGRADLAAVAYEHSLSLDPLQTESYYSLGMIMEEVDLEQAVGYYHRMLVSAPSYNDMDASALRELIAISLHNLLGLISNSDGRISIIPDRELYEELAIEFPVPTDGQETVFEGELELNQLETFYPLAELLMGERRRELPKGVAVGCWKKKRK